MTNAPVDLEHVDNVLADTGTDGQTRGVLLRRAAVGLAGVGILGSTGAAVAGAARRQQGMDTVETVVTTAITAEALAVTFLTEAVMRTKEQPSLLPGPLVEVLKAANRSEFRHHQVLAAAGGKPLTTRFWIPDALYGDGLVNLFRSIEAAEALFVNAYLVGITVFAEAGNPKLARYAGEILGVEAEHRVMARQARDILEKRQNRPGFVPNNQAFEIYRLKTTAEHVGALQALGIGFGQEGGKPGAFYDFPGDPLANGTGFPLVAPSPA